MFILRSRLWLKSTGHIYSDAVNWAQYLAQKVIALCVHIPSNISLRNSRIGYSVPKVLHVK